jgi:hypothetical protein
MWRKFYGWSSLVFFIAILAAILIPIFLSETALESFFSDYGTHVSSVAVNIGCGIFSACLIAWIIEHMQERHRAQEALIEVDVKVYTFVKLAGTAYETRSINLLNTVIGLIWTLAEWSVHNPIKQGLNKKLAKQLTSKLTEMKTYVNSIEVCCSSLIQLDTKIASQRARLFETAEVQTADNQSHRKASAELRGQRDNLRNDEEQMNGLYAELSRHISDLADARQAFNNMYTKK